jgi:hypothetical protein
VKRNTSSFALSDSINEGLDEDVRISSEKKKTEVDNKLGFFYGLKRREKKKCIVIEVFNIKSTRYN